MQRWMIGLFMAALFLSYQNCGSPQDFAGASGEQNLKAGGNDTIDAEWTGVEFSDDSFSQDGPGRYHIDLASGEVFPVDNGSHVQKVSSGEVYCLSEDELNEIRSIIDSASVCAPSNERDPDQMCTMDYRYPYAWLVGEEPQGDAVVALGEKVDGCHKPVDLCGDYSSILKGFIASIKSDLKSRSCAN